MGWPVLHRPLRTQLEGDFNATALATSRTAIVQETTCDASCAPIVKQFTAKLDHPSPLAGQIVHKTTCAGLPSNSILANYAPVNELRFLSA